MNSRIYIIGSEGYIGSMLQQMIPKDKLVRIGRPGGDYANEVITSLPKRVPQNSTCFLLAALAGEKGCEKNKKLAYETNVELVRKICDLNFKKIIFTSTSSVYGSSDNYATEESDVFVSSYYTETKLEGEEIVLSSKENNIVARLAIVIGVSPKTDWTQLANNLVKSALDGSKIDIYGASSYRPYFDVYDVVKGLILLNDTTYFNAQIINVGNTSLNKSKLDIIRELQKLIPNVNYSIVSEFDKRNYKVSFKKFERTYNASISLKETFINLINKYNADKKIKEVIT